MEVDPIWILSHHRSGSTWLAVSLSQSLGVSIDEKYPKGHKFEEMPPFGKLNALFRHSTPWTIEQLIEKYPKIRFIILSRRDILGSSISFNIAFQSSQFFINNGEQNERFKSFVPTYSYEKLKFLVDRTKNLLNIWDDIKQLNVPYITIDYEDLIYNRSYSEETLSRFIGKDIKLLPGIIQRENNCSYNVFRKKFLEDHPPRLLVLNGGFLSRLRILMSWRRELHDNQRLEVVWEINSHCPNSITELIETPENVVMWETTNSDETLDRLDISDIIEGQPKSLDDYYYLKPKKAVIDEYYDIRGKLPPKYALLITGNHSDHPSEEQRKYLQRLPKDMVVFHNAKTLESQILLRDRGYMCIRNLEGNGEFRIITMREELIILFLSRNATHFIGDGSEESLIVEQMRKETAHWNVEI